MQLLTTLAALIITYALAAAAKSASSTSAYPTVSLFFPVGGDLAASVITVGPSATVYALGCLETASACVECSLGTTVTITEGASTLAYEWTDMSGQAATAFGQNNTSYYPDVTTVNCDLYGTTSAVCTGRSYGDWSTTTTLVSSQISYFGVAITAGATASGFSISSSSASSSGAASTATQLGGAAPLATVGIYGMVAGLGAAAWL